MAELLFSPLYADLREYLVVEFLLPQPPFSDPLGLHGLLAYSLDVPQSSHLPAWKRHATIKEARQGAKSQLRQLYLSLSLVSKAWYCTIQDIYWTTWLPWLMGLPTDAYRWNAMSRSWENNKPEEILEAESNEEGGGAGRAPTLRVRRPSEWQLDLHSKAGRLAVLVVARGGANVDTYVECCRCRNDAMSLAMVQDTAAGREPHSFPPPPSLATLNDLAASFPLVTRIRQDTSLGSDPSSYKSKEQLWMNPLVFPLLMQAISRLPSLDTIPSAAMFPPCDKGLVGKVLSPTEGASDSGGLVEPFALTFDFSEPNMPQNITHIGDEFLSCFDEVALHRLSFPETLRSIGDGFLSRTTIISSQNSASGGHLLHLDFTPCGSSLEEIGSRFCGEADNIMVTLQREKTKETPNCALCVTFGNNGLDGRSNAAPVVLRKLGSDFMRSSKAVKVVDLGRCDRLTELTDGFLSNSSVEVVVLPRSIVKLSGLDRCSALKSLNSAGTEMAHRRSTAGGVFDLSTLVNLQFVDRFFLIENKHCVELRFPRSSQEQGPGPRSGTPRQISRDFALGCKSLRRLPGFSEFLLSSSGLIPDSFLGGTGIELVDSRTVLNPSITTIGHGCFASCFSLAIVDMSQCNQLTAIGMGFLQNSAVQEVRFPPSIRVIRDSCLSGCEKLQVLVAELPSLEVLGADFLASSSLSSSLVATTPKTNTIEVQVAAPTNSPNFPHGLTESTALRRVRFLTSEALPLSVELAFPTSFHKLPTGMFQALEGVVLLDLSELLITTIPAEFCSDCPHLAQVTLPRGIQGIEEDALVRCPSLKRLTFAPPSDRNGVTTLVEELNGRVGGGGPAVSPTRGIGPRFLSQSALENLPFAASENTNVEQDDFFKGSFFRTVEFTGDHFLGNCKSLNRVDFVEAGLTSLTTIGDNFLAESSVTCIMLNPQIQAIGKYFAQSCANLRRIDLSHCRLVRVGGYFLHNALHLEEIALPRTLNSVENGFLAGCVALKALDLFHTSVVQVGVRFLSESGVRRLRLPLTLRAPYGIRGQDLANLEQLEVLSAGDNLMSSLVALKPSVTVVTPQQWEQDGTAPTTTATAVGLSFLHLSLGPPPPSSNVSVKTSKTWLPR